MTLYESARARLLAPLVLAMVIAQSGPAAGGAPARAGSGATPPVTAPTGCDRVSRPASSSDPYAGLAIRPHPDGTGRCGGTPATGRRAAGPPASVSRAAGRRGMATDPPPRDDTVLGASQGRPGAAPLAASATVTAVRVSLSAVPGTPVAPAVPTGTAGFPAPTAVVSPPTAVRDGSPVPTATPLPDSTTVPSRDGSAAVAGATSPGTASGWRIRSVDSMKLSRDTLRAPLSDAQIAADVALDATLHLTHIAVDVYYDDPAYMGRWVRAVRRAGLHIWFRAHWYAWEDHRERRGDMDPRAYIAATRRFLQGHAGLLQDGDIFDFCPEPENGAYWLQTYGDGWSWRNRAAKSAFNTFIRSGIYMASTTLAHRGRGGVLVTVVSVNASIAERMLSKPTVERLGMITLDLYSEGQTRDPGVATARLLAEIARVRRRWAVPILLGEHGYARDMRVDDTTQARVLAAELSALGRVPYLQGQNYWVDAGGPGYGGYTNLYSRVRGSWQRRPAATTLARAYVALSR